MGENVSIRRETLSRWRGWFAAGLIGPLVAVLGAAGAPPEGPKAVPTTPAPQHDDLMRQSNYVFRGTVKTLNATTEKIVPATDRTVVVHVDEVLHGAGTIGDFTGTDVTVELEVAGAVKPGQQAVWYTNVKAIGKSAAFAEVGHLEAANAQNQATLRSQVAAGAQDRAESPRE